MTTDTEYFVPCDNATLIGQLDRWTIFAVSGGRVQRRDTGITLPIRYGYRVTIDLTIMDSYVVRRVFTRGDKTWIKGEEECFVWTLDDAVYRASCYHHDNFGKD